MERAGFKHILLNDFDKYATATLKRNRPEWNVLCQDISTVDFTEFNLDNSNYNLFYSNELINNSYGIYSDTSNYNNLSSNTIQNNTNGFYAINSIDSIVKSNTFESNGNYAIYLDADSDNGLFYNNSNNIIIPLLAKKLL